MTPEKAPRLRSATWADLKEARSLLRQGLSLRETANILDVFSSGLDRVLWGACGKPDDWNPWGRPAGMF